jgi:23S rRNA-intervening sequence protein
MSESAGTFGSLGKGFVQDYTDLLAYWMSFKLSKEIFEVTKQFPKQEMFRWAIMSVETDIAEAWGKRRYEEHFASKLTHADAERLATPNSAYCLLLTILPPTAY